MGERKSTMIGMACGFIILLVVAFVVIGSLQKPERIVLPSEPNGNEQSEAPSDEAVHRIDVRPDTVQSVIAALSRPAVYRRTITLERYWENGSGVSTIDARAADGWLRLDVTDAAGQLRHVLTGDGMTYIWYGGSRRYFSGAAVLSQDAEQGILTYENILALAVEEIAAADYRDLEGVACIYVETARNEAGYTERYWVGVKSGLLVAAERLCEGEVIYRMAALNVQTEGVDAAAFTLPDGTVLYEPAAVSIESEGSGAGEKKTG